jgi:hypothetical protein
VKDSKELREAKKKIFGQIEELEKLITEQGSEQLVRHQPQKRTKKQIVGVR